MRAASIVAIVLIICVAAPALADDAPLNTPPGWVPPPPPPPLTDGQAVTPTAYTPSPYATDSVFAQPRGAVPMPTPDASFQGVTCYQRRDACGWPIDCKGCKYGRFELVLEGTYSMLPSPDGRLGPLAIGAMAPQFDWDEMDYEAALGGRAAVRYAVAPRQWIELRGAYYGETDDAASRVGTFGFRPGIGGAGNTVTSNPVVGTMESEAVAYGGELNYQGEVSCNGRLRTDLILGARYFRFEEDSQIGFANAPILGFAGPAGIQSSSTSQFIGLQVGGVAHLDLAQGFELYGMAKLFGGWMRHEAEVTDLSIFAGGPHLSSDDEDDLQWGGEVELGMRWRLARWLSIQAGYNLFALGGVQRAYDAMDLTESTSGAVQARMATDEIVIHSVFAGLTFSF